VPETSQPRKETRLEFFNIAGPKTAKMIPKRGWDFSPGKENVFLIGNVEFLPSPGSENVNGGVNRGVFRRDR